MINNLIKYINHKDNYRVTMTWFLTILSLTVVVVILGFSGFYFAEKLPWWKALYSTLRLFVLDFDSTSKETILLLEFARWIAVVIVFASVLLLFTSSFYYYFKFLYYTHSRNSIVIIGLNDNTLEFVKDLTDNKKKVVIITFNSDSEIINKAVNLGVLVIVGELNDFRTYKSANIKHASRIILMDDADYTNMECLVFLVEHLKNIKKKCYDIKVHIKDNIYYDIIAQIEQEHLSKISINSFHIYRNMAIKVNQDHPFYEKSHQAIPHMLIIGLGDLGRQFLEQTLKLGHYPSLQKMKITLIDADEEIISQCREYYGAFSEHFELIYFTQDARSFDYHSYSSPDYCLITINNNNINMTIVDKLSNAYPNSKIIARLFQHDQLSKWINKNIRKYHNLYTYSISKEIVSEKVIINEELEQLGKYYEESYQRLLNRSSSWSSLSAFYKESNMLAAEHVRVKLNSVGLDYVERIKPTTSSQLNDQVKWILAQHKEAFAKCEHNRWCTFLGLKGYVWNAVRNDQLKQHPLLLPWEQLSAKDKQKNIDLIDTIIEIISQKYDIIVKG